jgi:hypothetical protein
MKRATVLLTAMVAAIVLTSEMALSQTTPSGTLDANTLPAPDPHHYCGEWNVQGTLLGQTFTALNSGNVHSVQLFVRGFDQTVTDPWSPPQSDLSVRLTTVDASGRPDTTLATTTVPGSEVGQFHSLVSANFTNPPSIEAGKQYALVLSTQTGSGYAWAFAEDGSCPYGSYSGGMLWVHIPADGGWVPDPVSDGLADAVFAICLNGPCPIDTTPPQLNLSNGVSQTATSPNGATVSYTATATDDVDGDLPVDCSPASGSTFPVGTTTVNCSAEDAAGNVATGSFEVRVVYDFGNGSGGGFSEPVSSSTLNEMKAGAGVPVKFGLGGDFGLDIFAAGYPTSRKISCETGLPTDPVEETLAVSATGLGYDASADQYVYSWRTDRAWSASCRELVLKLKDGSEHTVKFKFK